MKNTSKMVKSLAGGCITLLLFVGVATIVTPSSQVEAARIIFFGLDNNATGMFPLSSHPNADAARAAFLANLIAGTLGLQDFDGLATGPLTPTLGFPPSGATASFTSLSTDGSSIISGVTPLLQFAVSGSQCLLTTTAEDNQFFSLTFSSPQRAFGFYATDPSDYFGSAAPSGTPPLRLLLEGSGGSTLLDVLPGVDVSTVRDGSVIFFGVIETSNPFTKITLVNPVTGLGAIGTDGICVDDITIGPVIEITVAIDIKPGSSPNSVNPKSKGVIPVAILTTDTFDAATVDPNTVTFGPNGAAPVHSALENVDGDGDTDLILHFNTQATGIQCGDTSASLTGETFSGQTIHGSDSINTVGCK
jgi:hypothetical protein